MRVADQISAPEIEVRQAPGCYILHATLAIGKLLSASSRLGVAVVIEETSGSMSYWALAHPPGKPDFHHADCYAYELS